MSWPSTTNANNFRQTYMKGFLDISGGDITNRTGGLYINSDISSNSNMYTKNHISIGTDTTSFSANSLYYANEQMTFTIPLFLDNLKYFSSSAASTVIGDFDIADPTTETDTTYYVRLTSSTFPYFAFSLEQNGTEINNSSTNLTLYRGNTYTFIRSDTSNGYQFNIGSAHNVNNTGMNIVSTGTGISVSGSYTYEYPLSVNGTAKINKNLLVERDLSLNGMINMGSVVYQF